VERSHDLPHLLPQRVLPVERPVLAGGLEPGRHGPAQFREPLVQSTHLHDPEAPRDRPKGGRRILVTRQRPLQDAPNAHGVELHLRGLQAVVPFSISSRISRHAFMHSVPIPGQELAWGDPQPGGQHEHGIQLRSTPLAPRAHGLRVQSQHPRERIDVAGGPRPDGFVQGLSQTISPCHSACTGWDRQQFADGSRPPPLLSEDLVRSWM
jgi:hypothetical protein